MKSIIKDEQLISERDQVDQEIAGYFQEVYAGDGQNFESDEDLALWTRLEAASGVTLGMFTISDVEGP